MREQRHIGVYPTVRGLCRGHTAMVSKGFKLMTRALLFNVLATENHRDYLNAVI